MPVKPAYDQDGNVTGVEVIAAAEGSSSPPSKAAYDSYVARMDTLARQAARVAKGRVVLNTAAKRDDALVALAEAIAMMWFIERYEDEGNS